MIGVEKYTSFSTGENGTTSHGYEVYEQPFKDWLRGRIECCIAMSTVKPGIKQLMAVVERVADRRHAKRCNNDCSEAIIYHRDTSVTDGMAMVATTGKYEPVCGYWPLDCRLDERAYHYEHLNRTTLGRVETETVDTRSE